MDARNPRSSAIAAFVSPNRGASLAHATSSGADTPLGTNAAVTAAAAVTVGATVTAAAAAAAAAFAAVVAVAEASAVADTCGTTNAAAFCSSSCFAGALTLPNPKKEIKLLSVSFGLACSSSVELVTDLAAAAAAGGGGGGSMAATTCIFFLVRCALSKLAVAMAVGGGRMRASSSPHACAKRPCWVSTVASAPMAMECAGSNFRHDTKQGTALSKSPSV
mmetsp:Transcript_66072/g.133104  ORF Transcript_66072/g.133104 Transcript_66072/m.133104 type:complete len:220 (+) Transcript_66072:1801-2460(+)